MGSLTKPKQLPGKFGTLCRAACKCTSHPPSTSFLPPDNLLVLLICYFLCKKPFLPAASPFSRKGFWVTFPRPGLLGSPGMQFLLHPSRTCHQDLLGGKKGTTLCFFYTCNISPPWPWQRRKEITQKYTQLAVFSAVYEIKFSCAPSLSKCTFIVKLLFQEKDFLAKREMKWKLKCSRRLCCSQVSAALTLHVSGVSASNGWKDVKRVCYRVAASKGGLWALSQDGSFWLHGWFTWLHRWFSRLCATPSALGTAIQGLQWHLCSHCLTPLPHFPWKTASVFPTRWVTGWNALSLACKRIFWGRPGPTGRAKEKWDKATASSLCFPASRCGSGGATKANYTKSCLWGVCFYPTFCHTLLHAVVPSL